jgi:hypothetical protein
MMRRLVVWLFFFDEYQGDSSEEDQGATPLCVVFCFLFSSFFYFLVSFWLRVLCGNFVCESL